MMREIARAAAATLLALSLGACGTGANSQKEQANDAPAAEEAPTDPTPDAQEAPDEYDPNVERIDLALEGGSVRFDHAEKANPELCDADGAWVFVFDFTNEQATPAQAQSVFRFQFFQNGVELTDNVTYSSKGGEQYELVSAFFDSAMKGGTVHFGKIVVPKDASPITVMVSQNGASLEENYQMMEVALDGSGDEGGAPATASAEDIDAALQGTWSLGEGNTVTFSQGSVNFSTEGGPSLDGTYEVDVDNGLIVCRLQATDGTVKATISFTHDGQTLALYNNQGQQMIKQ